MTSNNISNEIGLEHQEELLINQKINDLYIKYFHLVKSYILNNSGDLEDAKDVFQEVALVFFKLASKEDHSSVENIKNYLMGITRNIWLKNLKKKGRIEEVHVESWDAVDTKSEPADDTLFENSKINLIVKKVEEISDECRRIIESAFYLKLSALQISEQMGYSEKFVKLKKFRCLQFLKKLVFSSPEYRRLLS